MLSNGSPGDLIKASRAGSLAALMVVPTDRGWSPVFTTPIVALLATAFVFLQSAREILAADPMPTFEASKNYDLGSLVELGMANNPKTRSALFTARAAGAAAREAQIGRAHV